MHSDRFPSGANGAFNITEQIHSLEREERLALSRKDFQSATQIAHTRTRLKEARNLSHYKLAKLEETRS